MHIFLVTKIFFMTIEPLCQALNYDLLQYSLTHFRMGRGGGGVRAKSSPFPTRFSLVISTNVQSSPSKLPDI